MTRPLYRDIATKKSLEGRTRAFHAGLWFDRFVDDWHDEYRAESKEAFTQKKNKWIRNIAGTADTPKTVGNPAQLTEYSRRQAALIGAVGGQFGVFRTDWHFITGMGLPHPVENGFAWHPTLGTPYLCGAAVKGLLHTWMEYWQEDASPDLIKKWFGGEDGEGSGGLIFFDAVPVIPPLLTPDIMTPHMNKWYEEGEQKPLSAEVLPGDWHDPVPVQFLAVKQASFLFGIAPRTTMMNDDVARAFEELGNALEFLGAGAKTAAGYGVMSRDEAQEKALKDWQKKQREAQLALLEQARNEAEQARLKLEEAEHWASLSEAGKLLDDLEKIIKDIQERDEAGTLVAKDAKESLRPMFNRVFKSGFTWTEEEKHKVISLIEASYMLWNKKEKDKLAKKITNKFDGSSSAG